MLKYFIITVLLIILGTWIYCLNWRAPIIANIKAKIFYKKFKNNKRTISNEKIRENFDFLKEQFKFRYIEIEKKKLEIPDNLRRKIIYSDFREKEMRELLNIILDYMKLDNEIKFNIVYCSSRNRPEYVGKYMIDNKEILLYINLRDDTFDSILACLIHECTHYFLYTNGIKKEDKNENEILTDLCTIYLVLGKQMYNGYCARNKSLYDGHTIYRGYRKTGYINPGDIKYAIKIRKKYL